MKIVLELALLGDVVLQLRNGDTDLLHGVAVADGDAVVSLHLAVTDGLEVHGDAQGGADLVLTAVALADGTGIVEVHHEVLTQHLVDFLSLGGQLLAQRQDSSLEGSQSRMQMQHGADIGVALLVHTHLLFVVSFAKESQSHTVAAQRRLDDIGDVMLAPLLVEVGQLLAGSFLVTAQVVVSSVSNAPQFAPAVAEGELELDVGGSTGVEGQLSGIVITQPQAVFLDAQAQQPVLAEILPVGKPLQVGAELLRK